MLFTPTEPRSSRNFRQQWRSKRQGCYSVGSHWRTLKRQRPRSRSTVSRFGYGDDLGAGASHKLGQRWTPFAVPTWTRVWLERSASSDPTKWRSRAKGLTSIPSSRARAGKGREPSWIVGSEYGQADFRLCRAIGDGNHCPRRANFASALSTEQHSLVVRHSGVLREVGGGRLSEMSR